MAYFSQPSHRKSNALSDYQTWILEVIEGTYEAFQREFKNLWGSERTGILFPQSLFEDQGDSSELALNDMLQHIWQDAVAICGIEMHRRILSLAHNADFEEVIDIKERSQLEARNLMMGRELILNNKTIKDVSELTKMARKFNSENYL